jgi:ferredoxin, 2Fe-2S
MARIIYIGHDGSRRELELEPGMSVMEGAINHNVPGIIAECGGACSCATCHVYVAPEWAARLPPPEPMELGMLECALDRRENSRLSCQIEVDDTLDGLVVEVPEHQA